MWSSFLAETRNFLMTLLVAWQRCGQLISVCTQSVQTILTCFSHNVPISHIYCFIQHFDWELSANWVLSVFLQSAVVKLSSSWPIVHTSFRIICQIKLSLLSHIHSTMFYGMNFLHLTHSKCSEHWQENDINPPETPHRKALPQILDPEPSCCETTVLTTDPPSCQTTKREQKKKWNVYNLNLSLRRIPLNKKRLLLLKEDCGLFTSQEKKSLHWLVCSAI